MSREAEKLFQKAQNTTANWRTHELITLYSGFGFIIREGEGSHRVVSHPEFPNEKDLYTTFIEHPGEVPPVYVRKARTIIKRLIVLRAERDRHD
jgi:hypothetical protein